MKHHHHHHTGSDTHDHDHSHDHASLGHNHSHDHMHSHVHVDPNKERLHRLQALATSFIQGFRSAEDKPAFLELSSIPKKRTGSDGLTMHLIDVSIASNWQMGTASPAFASRELVYLPYSDSMISERETMTFTYVSLTERDDVDLINILDKIHN